jgi:nicotinamidase-related amidase
VEKVRREQVPVVWVQHSDNGLAPEFDEWQIVPELAPAEAEILVDKHYGDAFEDTDLEPVWSDLGVWRLVVAGAQTDAASARPCAARSSVVTTPPWSATPTAGREACRRAAASIRRRGQETR